MFTFFLDPPVLYFFMLLRWEKKQKKFWFSLSLSAKMKKSRLLFLVCVIPNKFMFHIYLIWQAVTVISVSGSPDPEAQFAPGLDSSSGMMQPPAGGQSRPPSQCGLQVDECCGMANEGCCMAGQECFTYYETVCENVQTQRCKPKFKQICVEEELPDCTIEKKRGSVGRYFQQRNVA